MQKLTLTTLLVFFLAAMQVYAGPWPRKKFSGYSQLGFYGIPPTTSLFANGFNTRYMHRAVFDGTIQAYGEFGITDRFTVHTNLPLKIMASSPNTFLPPSDASPGFLPAPIDSLASGTLVGLGNYELGGKYNFYNKGVYLTGHLSIMMPTGRQDKTTGLLTAYRSWGFAPSFSVGTSGNKWYLAVDLGGTLRTNGYSHDWFSNLEFGYNIFWKVYLSATVNARFAFPDNKEVTPFDSQSEAIHTGTFVNQQGYLAWSVKAFVPFTKNSDVGVSLSFAGALLGNNVQESPAIGLGFFYQWGHYDKVKPMEG